MHRVTASPQRRTSSVSSVVSLLLLAGLAGCQNAGQDRVLSIGSTSRVAGLAYFDANRSKSFDSTDTPMQGLRVYLSARGTSDTLATAVSDATGVLTFDGVPVGRYDVNVDSASAGDTVVVVRVDTSQVDVALGDTVSVSVGVSYPLVTVADARTAPTGQRVFVAGVALTGTNNFADTTAHLVAATGPLRLVRVFTGFFSPGDSILARGTVSARDGEPVLSDVSVFTRGIGTLAAPDSLPTATAAGADGGALDAGLARAGGTLQDTITVGRDRALDVDDGSGVLRVLLDGDVTFQLSPYMVTPARIVATGVLVPAAVAGTWYLKPRSAVDVKVFIDVTPTVQVRQKPVGSRVFVDGVALNRPNLFGDSTMHMVDSSGAIRVINATQATIQQGDSIRVAGALAMRDGQPVLTNATIYRLGVGTVPLARLLTPGEAASALGGVLDAAFVHVSGTGVVVKDTMTTVANGDFRAVVWTGTGSDSVTVVLDADLGFSQTAIQAWAPGAAVDVRGLLVPESGVWVLKPRSQADITQP
jgi:hypothetical protein